MTINKGHKRVRAVQRDVLTYLQVHGPQRLHELSRHFTVASGVNIAPVLADLTSCGHIVVTKLDEVTILTVTKSGLNLV
jgi:hypothetical protein